MVHRKREIDRSTDVRTNRTSSGHFILNFRYSSRETNDKNIENFGEFLKNNYYKERKGKCVGPQ